MGHTTPTALCMLGSQIARAMFTTSCIHTKKWRVGSLLIIKDGRRA